jgi:glutamyl-Q tRNA(Asp) synthetase
MPDTNPHQSNHSTYIGRFAPSPTGPLHLGSLIAAVASYLEARTRNGLWLMRMEDLDPPREEPNAAQTILNSLQQHGLQWDAEVLRQSQRHNAYQKTINDLLSEKKAYFCTCSRAEIQQMGGIYDGRCRGHFKATEKQAAIRLQLQNAHAAVTFEDALQGKISQNLNKDVGDFVIKRKDGLYAYQLAVVLDDFEQGVTDIVRGSDLLDSTPRQIYLQQQLGLTTPNYVHIPVITHQNGQKLSKQTFAPALNNEQASQNLRLALHFLGQAEPPANAQTPQEILASASEHWQLQQIPHTQAIDQAILDNFDG